MFFFAVLILRLYYLQIISHTAFSKVADRQQKLTIELDPKRGTIYDREMRILALNLNADSVYAKPRRITNKQEVSKKIAAALSMSEETVMKKIDRDKVFVWVKRKVSDEESEAIRDLAIDGIDLIQESKRFYPKEELACHVIGFAGTDNVGLEGIELKYDRYLKGKKGWITSLKDGKKRELVSFQADYVPPRNGSSVIVTIDEVIQHIAERELKKAFEKYKAKAASIVVMDPASGDILAIANLPNYDLNNFYRAAVDALRNRAISDFYEPGSAFKVFTASAALQEKVVSLEDVFFCEKGSYRVGRRVLHDHKPHGNLTFREIIEKSSNIGTVKAASRLGDEKLFSYINQFGFYEKTGVDIPGEGYGINRDISKWTRGSMLSIPMGQEVAATALQLAAALSCVVNGGNLMEPRIIREIIDERGIAVKRFRAKKKRTVISEDVSRKMRELLAGVVENGTGKRAAMSDYAAGGKTGTAQKADPTGGYSHRRYIASFIGFAPVEAPRICIVVSVDEPHPIYYGGLVAAPVFKDVGEEVLRYLKVNP
ncbi:MAG: penicillin-binding transpeptidase domain-containing protein [Candidatus Omnitrophota bacterium]